MNSDSSPSQHSEPSTAPAPIPSDESFEALLAKVAEAPTPRHRVQLRPEDLLGGHYRVLRELGRGGMGSVYLARDEELERSVAVKVGSARPQPAELVRMQREAQAMARVSHPNVVTVFEAGVHDGSLFIAMEFVPGGSLRDWMDQRRRPWREVVEMFVEIASGLAAAHGADVTHRDFKPANVLVGEGQRPRVADFGLAQLPSQAQATQPDASAVSLELTASGAIVGTPAYMAPEQHAGEDASSGSDQFSFCVSLFEALYGNRPFSGRTVTEIHDAILRQDVSLPTSESVVPDALRRLVYTGLALDPEHRHASMAALATKLRRVLSARRRRVLGASGALGLAAAALGGFQAATAIEEPPCEASDAAVTEVWPPDSLNSELAPDPDVLAQLDDYAEQLGAAYHDSCQANRVTQSLSDEDFALQSACLGRATTRLEALAGTLPVLERTPLRAEVNAMLNPVASCDDLELLRSMTNRHDHRSRRASATEDRAYFDTVRALMRVDLQRASASSPPDLQQLSEVETAARDGGFDDVLAHAIHLRALAAETPDAAAFEYGRAADLASGSGNEAALANVATQLAGTLLQSGEIQAAQVHHRYAMLLSRLADRRQTPGVDPQAQAIVGGRVELALGHAQVAADMLEPICRTLAAGQPRRTAALSTLGRAYLHLGRLRQALTQFRAALAESEPSVQPQSERIPILINTTLALQSLGRLDAAESTLAEVEAQLDPARAPQLQLILLNNQGKLARLRGAHDEALALQRQALQRAEALDDGLQIAFALDEIGELLRLRGELQPAQDALARAAELRDEAYGPGSLSAAETITRAARVYFDQGRPERAYAATSYSLRVRETHDDPPDSRAHTRFEQARALRALEREDEARTAATRAREECSGSEYASCTRLRARIDAWLREPAP